MTLIDDDAAAGEAVDDTVAVAAGAVLSIVTDVADHDPDSLHAYGEPPVPPDGPLADLVDAFLTGARARLEGLVGTGGARELATVLGDLARMSRGVEAATVSVANDVERRGGFFDDGHRTIKH